MRQVSAAGCNACEADLNVLATPFFDLARFGIGMGRVATGAGEVASVPTLEGDNWANGQWVLKWDPQESAELFGSMGASTPQAATDDRE